MNNWQDNKLSLGCCHYVVDSRFQRFGVSLATDSPFARTDRNLSKLNVNHLDGHENSEKKKSWRKKLADLFPGLVLTPGREGGSKLKLNFGKKTSQGDHWQF